MTRRTPSQYNWDKLEFDETILTKHFTPKKSRKIKFVVIHHMTIVGKGTGSANDACYRTWQSRKASAHYGIDGKHVRQFVWDRNVAWATGHILGNANGISIEHANRLAAPTWSVSEDTLAQSVRLTAQIHKTHGLGRPTDGKTLKQHRSFKATACPGPYIVGHWDGYVAKVRREYDRIAGLSPAPAPKPLEAKTRFEVTAGVLNGRTGPGMSFPVKVKRNKGFRFSSKKRSGNWVQASKYWYHIDYLKVVSGPELPAPKPPVAQVRVGTFNLPLDPAKIAGGDSRAEIAAKQINDSNLDVVALQELDRGKSAASHVYAKKLLDALGNKWEVVSPTAKWNENYLFYRPSKATLVTQQPDLILPSSAGGRHATRAVFKIDGREVTIMSTHLVSGASNGKAREVQGEVLSRYASGSTLILGDLNQAEVPKALADTHKTCRKSISLVATAKFGTYFRWGNRGASNAPKSYLDHILVPKGVQVSGYNLVGVTSDGVLTQPRASDHLLTIAALNL